MIDLHFHCLPRIDDGPETWDDAVALCRAAAEEGTDTIVATPHVLREPWINDDPSQLDHLVLELNTRLGGSPAILSGCELLFRFDLLDLLDQPRSPVVMLNRGSHLLIELPMLLIPREIGSVIHELVLLGITPVIAHPERHLIFAREVRRLERLVELGAVTQITAACITGEFGIAAKNACYEMLGAGLVHAVASDAHNLTRRPPRLAAAREAITRDFGPVLAQSLFEDNPRAIAGLTPHLAAQSGAQA